MISLFFRHRNVKEQIPQTIYQRLESKRTSSLSRVSYDIKHGRCASVGAVISLSPCEIYLYTYRRRLFLFSPCLMVNQNEVNIHATERIENAGNERTHSMPKKINKEEKERERLEKKRLFVRILHLSFLGFCCYSKINQSDKHQSMGNRYFDKTWLA